MRNSTSCLGRGAKSWSDWNRGGRGGGEGKGMVQAKERRQRQSEVVETERQSMVEFIKQAAKQKEELSYRR